MLRTGCFFHLHTCHMLRTGCFFHLHTCHMLRKWWGGLGGVGWGWWLDKMARQKSVVRTCTHVTCYGLDVSWTCTHVTCYESVCQCVQDTAPSYEPVTVRQFWSHWTQIIAGSTLSEQEPRFGKCVARIGIAQTESFLGFAFATRMLPKTFVESLRRHNDQAWTRKKADWQHRRNLQKCQNHGKYHCFCIHHDFDWRNAWFSAYQNNVQELIDIKNVEKMWFSWSRTSWNKKNHENDSVLARTYFKYVRAQRTSLFTCDKAKTMVFTMVLALPQEQDCYVVGEPQVLTDLCNVQKWMNLCDFWRRSCKWKILWERNQEDVDVWISKKIGWLSHMTFHLSNYLDAAASFPTRT